jgi:hypothetical protein
MKGCRGEIEIISNSGGKDRNARSDENELQTNSEQEKPHYSPLIRNAWLNAKVISCNSRLSISRQMFVLM